MAKRSKTQKAKASAARQARKAERAEEALASEQGADVKKDAEGEPSEADKKAEQLKKAKDADAKPAKADSKGSDAKKPAKKKRFQFLREVRGELKRVTWPTKKDVGQWTGVVVAALLFFGIYVAILDNLVITPSLIGVSSIEVQQSKPELESTGGEGNVGLETTDSSAEGEGASDAAVADATAEGDAQAATEDAADAAGDAEQQGSDQGSEG